MLTKVITFTAIWTVLISDELESEYVTTINTSKISNDLPLQIIQIPLELIRVFANSSSQSSGKVRVISTLFHNMEALFLSGKPGINK